MRETRNARLHVWLYLTFFPPIQSFPKWDTDRKITCEQTLMKGEGPRTSWTRELTDDGELILVRLFLNVHKASSSMKTPLTWHVKVGAEELESPAQSPDPLNPNVRVMK